MQIRKLKSTGFLLLGTNPDMGDIIEIIANKITDYEFDTFGDCTFDICDIAGNRNDADEMHYVLCTNRHTYIIQNFEEQYETEDGEEILMSLTFDICVLESDSKLNFKLL